MSSPEIPRAKSTKKTLTFVNLLLSSSGPNPSTSPRGLPPPQSRFQRSAYLRVVKGTSSCVLKSLLAERDLGSLPNGPHSRRRVNSELLGSSGIPKCWRSAAVLLPPPEINLWGRQGDFLEGFLGGRALRELSCRTAVELTRTCGGILTRTLLQLLGIHNSGRKSLFVGKRYLRV